MEQEDINIDSHGVAKPKSSYTYFMTLNGGNAKEGESKEGSVLAILAAKVRFLFSLLPDL